MRKLLIVGCGDIGLRAAKRLHGRYRILGLAKGADHAARLRSHDIIPLIGDLDSPASLRRLAGVAQYVLHFCPPTQDGERDLRTQNLLAALSRGKSLPRRLVYISTSGVYGNCEGAVVPETRTVAPASERAKRRLDAETKLRAWGKHNYVAVAILRAPGIYARDRLPLERLRNRTPVLEDSDDVYTNHIHADDLANIAVAALERARAGRIYNACDHSRLRMAEYFDLIARAFSLPPPPRISLSDAEARLSPRMLSFMTESRQLTNDRILRELKAKLAYPTVSSALHQWQALS